VRHADAFTVSASTMMKCFFGVGKVRCHNEAVEDIGRKADATGCSIASHPPKSAAGWGSLRRVRVRVGQPPVASSKGAINPAGGAAATALNAGVGALWVASTYGRSRQ
jgi:hypothetical protein